MGYEAKVFLLTLAGSVVLAAAFLYIQDLLYVRATGRPASERERDRAAWRNRPLTLRRYIWWSVLLGFAILFEAYMALWSREYKGWSKLIPTAWMVSGSLPFYHLQRRWRAQKLGLPDQLSGGAR